MAQTVFGAVKTTYFANLLLGIERGVALSYPATQYWGLATCNKGPRSALNSVTLATNDYICVIPTTGTRMQLYKCTSGGQLAASQGSLYPGVPNESISDGGATMVEQSSGLQGVTGASMAILAEPTIGSNAYARLAITSNTTNWAAASGGSIANAGVAWAWPQATPAGWTSGLQAVWGIFSVDSASAGAGNIWQIAGLTASFQVPALLTASIAAGNFTLTEF